MKHKHCGRKFCPADNLPAAGIDPAFRAAHLESCRDATSRRASRAEAEVIVLMRHDADELREHAPGWSWCAESERWVTDRWGCKAEVDVSGRWEARDPSGVTMSRGADSKSIFGAMDAAEKAVLQVLWMRR